MTGHLFKILRERMPCTQRGLAEFLGVDTTTIQSWESGRRPLTGLASTQFLTLRRRLLSIGADPALLLLLDATMDADAVIAHALDDEQVRDDWPVIPWQVGCSLELRLT